MMDAGNKWECGANVWFADPGSGASGVFSNSTATIIVATNGSGVASAPFTANSTAGGPYTVTASAAGVASPATFRSEKHTAEPQSHLHIVSPPPPATTKPTTCPH